MINYFDHPYCSNSKLSEIGRELGVIPEIKGEPYEKYRLGTLFDAVVTEPTLIDLKGLMVKEYPFKMDEYWQMRAMDKALKNNPIFSHFWALKPDYQKEVYKRVKFKGYELNMKAKLDFYIPGIVSDLKSTDCTSQMQFEPMVEMFGYHRQMVLYSILTGCERAIIFAVSKKKPYNVFVVQMKRGDNLWAEGLKQLNFLSFKYYMTHGEANS